MKTSMRGIALCAVGVERITSHELGRLGLKATDRKPGRVYFELDEQSLTEKLAAANIGLRTADRVLLELGRFPAADFDQFFAGIENLPWELCCFKDSRLHVERVRSRASRLSAQTSLQAMGQKAAYSRLMNTYRMHTMPETGNIVAARFYIENDECSVGIDTSGEPLHKRGYGKIIGEAPLKETVAASLLFFSGWNRKFPLLDPFCGSGTIAIEAALYALDYAPGLTRRFAFESMPFSKAGIIGSAREAFEKRIRNDVEVDIRASDINEGAVGMARRNAKAAGIGDWIRFETKNAQDAEPFSEKGYLLANPPYGKRLGTPEDAKALYSGLAGMRDRFFSAGWSMGFITDTDDFGSSFGKRPDAVHRIMNGAEEQWFHWYPARQGGFSGVSVI